MNDDDSPGVGFRHTIHTMNENSARVSEGLQQFRPKQSF